MFVFWSTLELVHPFPVHFKFESVLSSILFRPPPSFEVERFVGHLRGTPVSVYCDADALMRRAKEVKRHQDVTTWAWRRCHGGVDGWGRCLELGRRAPDIYNIYIYIFSLLYIL